MSMGTSPEGSPENGLPNSGEHAAGYEALRASLGPKLQELYDEVETIRQRAGTGHSEGPLDGIVE